MLYLLKEKISAETALNADKCMVVELAYQFWHINIDLRQIFRLANRLPQKKWIFWIY